jgi:L-glyceraldehyde 3-phosphate reductase
LTLGSDPEPSSTDELTIIRPHVDAWQNPAMTNSTYAPDPARYDGRMPYRRTGRSGLQLPAVSLGFWHNFGDDKPIEGQRAIMQRAFDLGITHFDLANNYGPPAGTAEINVGRILREDFSGLRDELVISSKAGWDMWPGPYGDLGSRKYLLASLDQSLARLGTDYVDIFYHHRPDPDTPIAESMGALHTAVQQGKALYAGISSYSPSRTLEAARILADLGTPLLIHQPSYSMFNRWIEAGLLEALEEVGAGCITFSPLAQGLLTGRYLDGIPGDSRAAAGKSLFDSHLSDENIERVKALAAIAEGRGQSLAQMAVSWTLRDPRVTTTLLGASSVRQLDETAAAVQCLDFTDAELAAIDEYAVEADINLWAAQSLIP